MARTDRRAGKKTAVIVILLLLLAALAAGGYWFFTHYAFFRGEIIPLDTAELEVSRDALRTTDGDGKQAVWPLSLTEWKPAENAETSVRAAKTENGLLIHLCHITTPFEITMELIFTPHGIEIRGKRNVGFGGGDFGIIGYKK